MSSLLVTTAPVVFEESEGDAAYDKIDHLLRSTLDDSDYAEYSAALDRVFWSSEDGSVRESLSDLIYGDVGKQTLAKLATGQGTDTDDGRAWLRAAKLVGAI